MKKIRKLHLEKLNSIVQTNYAVVDLVEYNEMLYKSIKDEARWNRVYHIIYDSTLSKQKKYDKLKDILLGK